MHVHVTQPGAHLPRVLVVLGHHAQATIYLEHTSAGDVDALVDEVVEFVVQDAARLDVVSLQEWGERHPPPRAPEGRGAPRRRPSATCRHRRRRHRAAASRGRPASAPARRPGRSALYFADEGQWFDLQPYVRHLAPKATSDVLYKGALQGKSRTVFRGNVFVHKDAVGTVTDENNRSLILSPGARADSTPFLEIECADITAGHGSATGQIDARHLFYLEARGIPRDQALRLIVHGLLPRGPHRGRPARRRGARACATSRPRSPPSTSTALAVSDAALRDELSRLMATRVASLADLPDVTPVRVDVDGVPVCLVRLGDDVRAVHDVCSHQEWSLSDGGQVFDARGRVLAARLDLLARRRPSVRRCPAMKPGPDLRRARSTATTSSSTSSVALNGATDPRLLTTPTHAPTAPRQARHSSTTRTTHDG